MPAGTLVPSASVLIDVRVTESDYCCGGEVTYVALDASPDGTAQVRAGRPEDGLVPPVRLMWGTRLFANKTTRADVGHHGEMTLVQTYGEFLPTSGTTAK